MGMPGWPAFVHYPDDTSEVVVLLEPGPTAAGDRVVILGDARPWIATEVHSGAGEFEGEPYDLRVWVELPVPAA
jgi:hypothetical protein